MTKEPDFLLFAQHGWADTGNDIGRLARSLASHKTMTIVPSLNWLQTSLRIEPLIREVERLAGETIASYPETPIRIIGHSMGGLIWLEVLHRHREWWSKVHSLVVIGSPIGGSDVARKIDPFSMGIGIARDLGKNRRNLAVNIASEIPTLSIASDIGLGTDGLVTVPNTKFDRANWILISGIRHAALKCHPQVGSLIAEFWNAPQISNLADVNLAVKLIDRLQALPGMTDTDYRYLKRSRLAIEFDENLSIRIWHSPFKVNYVFIVDQSKCLYAGCVGILHTKALRETLAEFKTQSEIIK
jgi:pimeloyl-ACP methyl ester carboxylesterase